MTESPFHQLPFPAVPRVVLCVHCGTNVPPLEGLPQSDGTVLCRTCSATIDRNAMRVTGRAVLYLTPTDKCGDPSWHPACHYDATNWPGSLRFHVYRYRRGAHNICGPGSRTDVWFIGPDSYIWHGTTYGHNTQLLHCRRTRQRV